MENKYSRKYIIETGIGLQDVDHLKNSDFFLKEADRYVKGEITLDELDNIITTYYEEKPNVDDRAKEADKSSVNIGKIVSEDSFTFSVGQLISIHKFLFEDVFPHAGKLRTYNFTKKEWVLDGASVRYGDYHEISATLQYDFDVEKRFNYASLNINETIEHLAIFIANLWQIHAFEEGNTRTVAAFLIKYLRSLGFDVTNDILAKNAWYFRNALVRANYMNVQKRIYEDRSFLIKLLRNLILNEHNELKNRDLRIQEEPTHQPFEMNREWEIMGLMRRNPKIKTTELAEMLHVSLRTLKSLIALLQEKGLVKRVGGKKYGHWEVQ